MGMGKDWYRRKQKVIDMDGRKCRKCGSEENLTVDHIIPKSKGGSNKISNLQTLCLQCNRSKGNLMLEEKTK